jgi:hypothetical protein
MGEKMKKNLSILLALISLTFLQACHPMFYIAKDFSGKVIDADTNMPIEGVVVVAEWIPYHVGLGDGGHKSVMEVRETLTDKEGKYTILGWGPRLRPSFTYLDNQDPALFLFKKGYEYVSLSNGDIKQMYEYYGKEYLDNMPFEKFRTAEGFEYDRTIRTSIWNGRTIKMRNLSGKNDDLDRTLSAVDRDVLSKEDRGLPLNKVPLTFKEWNEARKDLK